MTINEIAEAYNLPPRVVSYRLRKLRLHPQRVGRRLLYELTDEAVVALSVPKAPHEKRNYKIATMRCGSGRRNRGRVLQVDLGGGIVMQAKISGGKNIPEESIVITPKKGNAATYAAFLKRMGQS